MTRAREHFRSNIVGYVALFLALAGGAYALPGKNSVDSGDIRNEQIRSGDIRNEQIRTADIRNNNVLGRDIRTGAVGTEDVGDNGLTGIDIAPDSLTGGDIAESSLLGVDATTFAGRESCEFNQRLTGNNSSSTDVTADVCSIGPFDVSVRCESEAAGENLSAVVRVTTTANGAAVAGDSPDFNFNPGEGFAEIQRLNDFTATNSPVMELVPFSVWVPGVAQLSGQSAIRADSLSSGDRTCDFAIFATG